jgi:hypothetical protein
MVSYIIDGIFIGISIYWIIRFILTIRNNMKPKQGWKKPWE